MSENYTVSSFKHICRTCLTQRETFSIAKVSWEGISLQEIMQKWTTVRFGDDEKLPKNMCTECIRQMYKTYHFLYQCKTSEILLKSILKKAETEIESEPVLQSESNDNKNTAKDDKKSLDTEDNDIVPEDVASLENDDTCADNSDDSKSIISNNSTEEEAPKASENIEDKIESIKNEIKQIQVKNKVRLKKMAKAKLASYNSIAQDNNIKTGKRTYVFRKGPPYTCITCDTSYPTHEELRKHKIETKHKKALKFVCPYCHRRTDAHSKYVEHVRTHTGEKPNICSTCGKAFNFKTDLKRHMVMHMEVKPYICRFCDQGFTRKQYLTDHERKHTGEQLICSFCGKGFHSYSTLSYHEKTHKGPPGCVKDPMSKDKLYPCHICDKVLLTEQTLKFHVLLHGPKNFSCEICGKTYISKNRLQDHIRFSHQDTKFMCNLCDKVYRQKSGLEVHMKSHAGLNNYPCELCGKQFACKGSLYQHKRIHTGDTKYQCKECLHICINKRHLENHLRVHSGEKPFACVYCGKLFAQKANMQAHTKIHTGEKNFLCKVCGKGFYDGRGLKKHMPVHEKQSENKVDYVKQEPKIVLS